MTTGHFRQQKARLVEQRIQLFFFFFFSADYFRVNIFLTTSVQLFLAIKRLLALKLRTSMA